MADENPDFSFLDQKKTANPEAASGITKKSEETEPSEAEDTDHVMSEPETPTTSESPSGLKWMDGPLLYQEPDSSTRFATSLGKSSEPKSATDHLRNIKQESKDETAEAEPAASATESSPEESSTSSKPEAVSEPQREETAEAPSETVDEVAITPPVIPPASDETSSSPAKVPEEKSKSAKEKSKSKPTPAKKADSRKSNRKTVSGLMLTLLVSYASAVTLICAYLVMQSFSGKPHDLESLPDLKPPMKDDEIAYRLVPEGATLAPGHTLRLGESRRYGNLLVTPLRVETSDLKFEHYTGDPARKRESVSDVMKLWIRFENVSKDQKFAPLDRTLVLKRIVDPDQPGRLRSNQFLTTVSDKGNLDRTFLLYDLEQYGDWNFAGIKDEPVLGPGESIETYLPAAAVADEELDGTVVWRIQFRKGYHPTSKRGVTTLIEVRFKKNQIQSA
ncbi:hypothetical protein [Rubinisphaera margarita]|uniref:hypothetical protein n=1 Tax=Rubinisphaera margarita TaxID=2909586 RepID=UPI001EE840EC|nr:hypothetical protein [Rubinisphaera margarita]MCG6157984.1 hypothetical protein [Rubinisphaera margarita]